MMSVNLRVKTVKTVNACSEWLKQAVKKKKKKNVEEKMWQISQNFVLFFLT